MHNSIKPRNYAAEWHDLEQSQLAMNEQKDVLYQAWADSIKARIGALYNPVAGRSMSVSAFQRLLPGYTTQSPVLLGALGGKRSVPLLMAASKRLDDLEGDPRFRMPPQDKTT